jgi:hypothetical protein
MPVLLLSLFSPFRGLLFRTVLLDLLESIMLQPVAVLLGMAAGFLSVCRRVIEMAGSGAAAESAGERTSRSPGKPQDCKKAS